MKTLTKIVLVSTLFAASQTMSASESVKDTVTFQVPMKCHKCQAKIENNISFEKGITDLSVNLEEKKVTVVYNKKKTDIEKLKAAFKKLGYDVEILK